MKIFSSDFDELLTQERKKYRLLPAPSILIISYIAIVGVVSFLVVVFQGPIFILIPWGMLAVGTSIFYPRRVYGSMLFSTFIIEGIALFIISDNAFVAWMTDFTGIMMSFILSELFHYLTINRLQAAKIHQDTETQFRIFIEQANDGIIIVQNGKILYVNNQFAQMFGYNTDELIQQPAEIFVNPELRAFVRQIVKINADDVGERFSETLQFQHKNGYLIDVEVNVSFVNHQGEPAIFAVARDVTARQAAEAELRQTTLELNLLNKLNYAANQGLSLDKIFAIFSEETTDLFSAYGATIFLLNNDETRLIAQKHSQPVSDKARRWIEELVGINLININLILKPDSLYQQSLEAKTPTIFTSPDEIQQMMVEFAHSMLPKGDFVQKFLQSSIPKIYKYLNIKSVLHIPLVVEDEVLGLFEFSGANIDTFPSARIAGLENIARQMATIIKQRRLQDALAYSEALYVSLVENIPLNIFRKDHTGRITFVNQNYCQTEGKTENEILGKTDFDLHPAELAEKYRREDKMVMDSGQPLEVIERHQPIGGNPVYVRTRKTPLYDNNGRVIGLQGVFEDITSQKESETRLRYYAERLNMLHKIDQAILTAQSLEEVAQSALEPILHLIPAERASVVFFDEKNNTGIILAALGAEEADLNVGAKIPLDNYLPYQRYTENPSTVSYRLVPLRDFGIEKRLKESHIDASMSFKLTSHHKAMGSLNIGFSNLDDMLPEYQTIVEEVATSLSVALQQQMQADQIKADAETKTRLLQEVDHRVKNNLANIAGMIYLELRYAKANDTGISIQTLEKLNVRVRSLAATHEMLARNEWHPLSLRDLTSKVINTTLRGLIPSGKEMIADIGQFDISVTPEHAQDFTLIFSEIIANVALFAMADRDKITMSLSVEEVEQDFQIIGRVNNVLFPKSMLDEKRDIPSVALLTQTIEHTLRGTMTLLNDGNDSLMIICFPRKSIMNVETND